MNTEHNDSKPRALADADAETSIHAGKFLFVNAMMNLLDAIIFYPMDLMKSRQMVTDIPSSSPSSSSSVPKVSLMSQMRSVWKLEGFFALYRGFLWFTISHAPFDASYYYFYTSTRTTFVNNEVGKTYPVLALIAASAVVDTTAVMMLVPIDIVSQRLQIQGLTSQNKVVPSKLLGAVPHPAFTKKPPNALQMVRDIAKTEGIRGFFRGTGLALSVSVPASAFWWVTCEQVKQICKQHIGNYSLTTTHVVAGAVAGFATTLVFNPMDVIKTRVQTMQVKQPAVEVALDLFRREGFFGFYKGIQPRLMSAIPRSALAFTIYELSLKLSRMSWSFS